MQVFDINIEPGKTRIIDQVANYIYFLNGLAGGGDTTIVVRPNSGGETVYLKPGQAYEFSQGEADTRWSITNLKGEGAIVGQLLFSNGRFTDNRVTGSVEVIDGGKGRTMNQQACMGYAYVGAIAAQFGHVQLFNAAGSGVNVFVEQVSYFSTGTVNGGIFLSRRGSNLLTLNGPGLKKKLGAPDSAASKIYVQNNAAQMNEGGYLGSLDKGVRLFKFTEPVQLTPGMGLLVTNLQLGEDLGATFEFFEEAV